MVNHDDGDVDQFVGILRPRRTATEKNIPLMGRVSDLIPGVCPWTQFYGSSKQTHNPYASNLCGFLAMRYTPTHTQIGDSFLLHSTCVPGDETAAATTQRLEQNYNMNIVKNLLTPEERDMINTGSLRTCQNRGRDNATIPSPANSTGDDLSDPAGITTNLGFAVPYTQSTQESALDADLRKPLPDAGYTTILGPADHAIVSAYTVPCY